MTTTLSTRKNLAFAGTFFALFFVLSFGVGAHAAYAATIDTQLDFGSTGQEVRDLQTYLSTDVSVYPSGLVTGYFGSLTRAGVQRFQTVQGIVSSGTPETTGYGRVGPTTMARLNALMSGATGNQSTLFTVPVLSGVSLQRTQTSATFSWSTNEPTRGQIYWSTSPIRADEATGPGQTPYVSGTLALDPNGLQTSHSVTVSNLQPGTLYNYFVRSIDASGDMSVILPSTFQTVQ
jgi:peptidoglycan hydrolase-like protein with peptidoglycan-binding domain